MALWHEDYFELKAIKNNKHKRNALSSPFHLKVEDKFTIVKVVTLPISTPVRGEWVFTTEETIQLLLLKMAPTWVCITNFTKQSLSSINFPHRFIFPQFTACSPNFFPFILPPLNNLLPFVKMVYKLWSLTTSLDFHFFFVRSHVHA